MRAAALWASLAGFLVYLPDGKADDGDETVAMSSVMLQGRESRTAAGAGRVFIHAAQPFDFARVERESFGDVEPYEAASLSE